MREALEAVIRLRALAANNKQKELWMITASQLYDFVRCPHRVALDLFADTSKRDEPNPFVQLLWEQGMDHEEHIVSGLDISVDLNLVPLGDRERETLAAIRRREPLIYGGRLTSGDLLGEPDLLKLRGDGYIPGDIKSGSGFEGDEDDGRLKKHYAYQLAHYVHILDQLGLSDGTREAFIIDRHAEDVPYPLDEQINTRNTSTWWESYLDALEAVRQITTRTAPTLGALCNECKLCHWYSNCKDELVSRDDLTLIAELGRAKRDAMMPTVGTVKAFAESNLDAYRSGKKTIFRGIGPDSLAKFHERAKLLSSRDAKPYLTDAVILPIAEKEVYFDIEADPMRDVVYLHGFVERLHGMPEAARFIPFFSDGIEPSHEEAAFRSAWDFLNAHIENSVVYYYSKYERTAYKKLAGKYPGVSKAEEVERLFAVPHMVDLLNDVVKKGTEWPTYDRSIKTLARYLGFQWRDTHPSGAASIEWYHRWIDSGDPAIKQRILDYNEDDCLATGVLVDGIREL